MEGNRDESERCISLAVDSMKLGQIEKAKKFLLKSERLYPSKRAKDLLNQLATAERVSTQEEGTENVDEAGVGGGSSSRRASQAGVGATSNDCHEIQPKYSQEQLEAVRRIRRCKDYYEILGLTKDCSDDELKKAYKKLALKFHPDKNQAPGATEAFKAIGNAFAVLSDSDKRKRYDEFGIEDSELRRRGRPNGYDYDFSRGFESDISAEDLFRMFFGGHVYHQTARHHRRQQQSRNESPYTFLLQLSPLVLIIVLSLLSSLLVSQPVYSLRRDAKYNHERKTRNLGVTYYVRDDFSTGGRDSVPLGQVERHVEEDYIVDLQHSCYRERANREAAMWRAQMYGNSELYKQARNLAMQSCDRLRQLNVGYH